MLKLLASKHVKFSTSS